MLAKIKVNLNKLEMMIDGNNSIESIQKKVTLLKRQLKSVDDGVYNPVGVLPLKKRFDKTLIRLSV